MAPPWRPPDQGTGLAILVTQIYSGPASRGVASCFGCDIPSGLSRTMAPVPLCGLRHGTARDRRARQHQGGIPSRQTFKMPAFAKASPVRTACLSFHSTMNGWTTTDANRRSSMQGEIVIAQGPIGGEPSRSARWPARSQCFLLHPVKSAPLHYQKGTQPLAALTGYIAWHGATGAFQRRHYTSDAPAPLLATSDSLARKHLEPFNRRRAHLADPRLQRNRRHFFLGFLQLDSQRFFSSVAPRSLKA